MICRALLTSVVTYDNMQEKCEVVDGNDPENTSHFMDQGGA